MNKKEGSKDVGDAKPRKIKQIYNVRDVVKQNYKDLVEAEIPEKSNEKGYIAKYQRAVTTVVDNMSESTLEEAKDIAEAWNKEGAPAEVQLK